MIKYQKNIDKIVTLTLDMKGQAHNIINHQISQVFLPILEKLEHEVQQEQVKGIIITSAKKTFLQGGNLDYLFHAQKSEADIIYQKIELLKSVYRRLEQLRVPVVAAINGTATGTGYELTLACHYRIALKSPKLLLGMPEVKLGFIPGGGGISRLSWLLGIEKAMPLLIDGRLVSENEALELGMIDEIVEDQQALMDRARAWIIANPNAQQPWDQQKHKKGDLQIHHPRNAQWIADTNAQLLKRFKGNIPAITVIFDIIVNSVSLDFDTATTIESRYFTQLITSPEAKNMTKTFWYDLNTIKKGVARPRGFGRFRPRRIGVIGAGQMGCGITAMATLAGMEVVLKDVSKPIADRGKMKVERILSEQLQQKHITQPELTAALNCVHTTNLVSDFEECDLVLEAVFENIGIKSKVIREASVHIDEYAMFASNTSSLSISRLARESSEPANFIGIKFFRPVQQTRLVEIIRGVKTSDETVAKAIDFVRKIRKVPIVIQDRRGFFTTRVMEAYGLEGIALLKDGCLPNVIEQTAINAGMQQPPLMMMDAMSISNTLMFEERKMKIFSPYWYTDEVEVMRKMVHELNRPGVMSQRGFYDYDGDAPRLWSGLVESFHVQQGKVITCVFSNQDIMERLLFVQSLEALRCLESRVLDTVEEINLASVYAWGFARHKGGVLQYINDYGVQAFADRAKVLAASYGQRFAPTQILLDKAAAGEEF